MAVNIYRTTNRGELRSSTPARTWISRRRTLGAPLSMSLLQKRKDLPKEVSSTPPEQARLDQQL
jgi:hypothetical protein